MKFILLSLCLLFATGCNIMTAPTLGEKARQEGNYGYTPLDPLPIDFEHQDDVLSLLPDTTMRLAIGSFDSQGNVTYGPIKVGIAGSRYQVILDYIQYTTLSIPVSVKPMPQSSEDLKAGKSKEYDVEILPESKAALADKNIPVYVGIGLRLTANITALQDNVDLSNIAALGVSASNHEINGTLTVQAMGISGESVSETLPMPSTLDQSTVQQALMALGNIKSKAYSKDKVLITPQVVAVYNPFHNSGPKSISSLIELLLLDQSSLHLHKGVTNSIGQTY